MQTLALLDLGPRDLRTGELVQVNDILDADGSGVVLPSIVSKAVVAASPIFHTVANRMVHPYAAGGVRRQILDCADERVLLSHGIDARALGELKQGDHARFLQARMAWLAPRLRTFFLAKARWDELDRASLRSLIVTDDEVDVA
ncbi:hypothetical protein [Verticiella alkaliphila]|uniref:hypothetical protein n=1 Tax=Verticiella alkaliphila TaxID=2779529 RepID=UPI001C0D20FF|nr:hypothetical protein [Verticiella sp. GG226]